MSFEFSVWYFTYFIVVATETEAYVDGGGGGDDDADDAAMMVDIVDYINK